MLHPRHFSKYFYDLYDKEKNKTPTDLFASQKKISAVNYKSRYNKEKTGNRHVLSSDHLKIILPDQSIKKNFENDVPSHKVFDIWIDGFDNQIGQEVGDVFVPRPMQGASQLEHDKGGNKKIQIVSKTRNSGRYPKTYFGHGGHRNTWIPTNAMQMI